MRPLANATTKLNLVIIPPFFHLFLIFTPPPVFLKTCYFKISSFVSTSRSPSERQTSWTVCTLLDQRFMKLASSSRVNDRPTLFTVILQARDVGAEKWREFSAAAYPMTFITHLVVKDVRFYFDLLVENTINQITRNAVKKLAIGLCWLYKFLNI